MFTEPQRFTLSPDHATSLFGDFKQLVSDALSLAQTVQGVDPTLIAQLIGAAGKLATDIAARNWVAMVSDGVALMQLMATVWKAADTAGTANTLVPPPITS